MTRIGVSLGTALSPDQDPSTIIDHARAANRSALDCLVVGDHHVTWPGDYLQNVPTLGRLLGEWDERPAGCLFLVPLWHPVLMAEQIGTLAALAGGPFIVQVGAGGGTREFEGMGVRLTDRRRRMEETIPLVQALLRGEEVNCASWGIHGARIAPVPSRGVEWWIGGGVLASVDRAARLGDCWYGNADLAPGTARPLLDAYREACARHDREPVRVPIRKDVFIAESRAEGERVGEARLSAGYRGFTREAVAYGDPESVAEQLSVYGQIGFTDILIRTMPAPPDASARSMELAGEVRSLLAQH